MFKNILQSDNLSCWYYQYFKISILVTQFSQDSWVFNLVGRRREGSKWCLCLFSIQSNLNFLFLNRNLSLSNWKKELEQFCLNTFSAWKSFCSHQMWWGTIWNFHLPVAEVPVLNSGSYGNQKCWVADPNLLPRIALHSLKTPPCLMKYIPWSSTFPLRQDILHGAGV